MADVTQLTPHVARIELMNATRTNVYVVRGSDGDTLVDPGPVGTAPIVLGLDRRGEIRLARVVLTHAHPAHAGSAARVARGTGVPVWVHQRDAAFLDGTREPLLPKGRRGQLMAALGRVVELCPPVFRLQTFVGGEVVGGLRVIETRGHTPGHVCLWHEEDGVLLTGDAVVVGAEGELELPAEELSEDADAARAAVAGLAEVVGRMRWVMPGHGEAVGVDAGGRLGRFVARVAGGG